ncbi:MAG: hypothetical protein ACM3NQ_07595 [Bacteroidales bacterium]
MTARTVARLASLVLALPLLAAGCTSFQEVTVETPLQAKLDVSQFQRVLVVGFIAGGSEDVDANMETVRLLRSQLRTKSSLKVIEADVLPLAEIAQQQAAQGAGGNLAAPGAQSTDGGLKPVPPIPAQQQVAEPASSQAAAAGTGLPAKIKDEKDLQAYDQIFANVAFWKKIGEEYQNPLIVTGTVLFQPMSKTGYVTSDREQFDPMGRRVVEQQRTYMERKGFVLNPKFIFIDGRTGTTLSSDTYREETLYNAQQNTPPLSSYFELMDRLIPRFLSTLSSQRIRGTRVLLK